ncbi:nitrite reductase large subunit [Alkalicoccus saliphilus]|uniref:Nitrite reductase large subunit n=2 Tax=Alkalicoccus saliphilus TaxID=200989 RepID=A0A2T4U2G3_9BACI|nr:nitrite reductase large subunit [Alkalicoccus saliphilus]
MEISFIIVCCIAGKLKKAASIWRESMSKLRLVLIGNGMAGMRTVEKIVEKYPDMFEITVFGKEKHPNYNRIMLSSVLQGDTALEDISIHTSSWYTDHHIDLYTDEEVTRIDKDKKSVTTDKHTTVFYDKLIIATGSNPFILPVPGAEKEGVLPFRTIEHCRYMIEASSRMKKAVVIGGGLLGLEAARGLLHLGMEVNVVHLGSYLMDRQLDETAARMLQGDLEEQGMTFLLEKQTEEISGENSRVERVHFKDGTSVEADLVVMSAGIAPNKKLAEQSGIETARGIIVDDEMKTNVPDIFAVGECAEHRGITYGLVQPLYEQSAVLAARLTEKENKKYEGSLLYTQLKISGLDVFSAGSLEENNTTRTMQMYDEVHKIYKKIIIQDEAVQGAVLYGDVRQQRKLLDLISSKKILSDEALQNLMVSSGAEEKIVESLPLHAHVCQCNSVSKEEIIRSVQEKGCSSTEEIKTCTKASGSCGSCRPLVEDMLAYIQSENFNEYPSRKTLCSCTDKTEEEIIKRIQEQQLDTVQKVFEASGWTDTEGCPLCLPAVTYYVEMMYPEKRSAADRTSTVVENTDGTFTFTVQLYGGEITPQELLKTAEAAEKYHIASLQLTPEQRLQFSGVRKKDLSGLIRELGMNLLTTASFTFKPARTMPEMKELERNRRPVTEAASFIEKKMENLPFPYRVRLYTGFSPEEKEEMQKQDFGLLAGDGGWGMYVGEKLLYAASGRQEVITLMLALIQYYREGAKFREPAAEWAERVNFVHIREVLFDPEMVDVLLNRLDKERKLQDSQVLTFV